MPEGLGGFGERKEFDNYIVPQKFADERQYNKGNDER